MNIEFFTRLKKVERTIEEPCTKLKCDCCGKEEVRVGSTTIDNLTGGWKCLELSSIDNGDVYGWLLCEDCTKAVKAAAGIEKGDE